MQRKYQVFIEKVVLGARHGYSLPDVVGSENVEPLIDAIESDPSISAMVYSQEATAQQIWAKLATTPIGKALLDNDKTLVDYRISSERKGKDGLQLDAYKQQRPNDSNSTTPMHYYDKWANERGKNTQGGGMPSFKEFFDPTKATKWRSNEVSGAGNKQEPVAVATQKQNPLQTPPEKE